MVRFSIDNIISSFNKHDKNTCLDVRGMRLRTFADLFNLAIVNIFVTYS